MRFYFSILVGFGLSLLVGLQPFARTFAAENTFIYRYKSDLIDIDLPVGEDLTKDAITAHFVGGVGYAFSEDIPVKTEWGDATWSLTSGNIPAGLTFDTPTRTFVGTPTDPATSQVVELKGVNAEGTVVGKARVTFDIYTMQGQPFFINAYAHTNHYKLLQLDAPLAGIIDSWTTISAPPPGITALGRNIEGVPTEAGKYATFLQAKNYLGEVIASYAITYVVEDSPTFNPVKDNILPVPYNMPRRFNFTAAKVNYAIDDPRKIKYYVEVKQGDVMPGAVRSNQQPYALRLSGNVPLAYQTAHIRWKARDVDDTVGYSNWFEFGTGDPSPYCGGVHPLSWVTGKTVNQFAGIPTGSQGTMSYRLASGVVPDGVTFDEATGFFKGVPTVKAPPRIVKLDVSSTSVAGEVVTRPCTFNIQVTNAGLRISDATSPQDTFLRVGDVYNGSLSLAGGIQNFDWSLDDPTTYPTFLFTTATANAVAVRTRGVISVPGDFDVPVSVANGDQNTVGGIFGVSMRGPLAFGDIPSVITVKKYADAQEWGTLGFDYMNVIPDASGATMQPQMTLSQPSDPDKALPGDLDFGSVKAPYGVYGMTSAKPGTYGPFTATISDFSGDRVTSLPFTVVVEERADMALGSLVPPVFTVDLGVPVTLQPVTVRQPPGAATLKITYALNGPEPLPGSLAFDSKTGRIVAQPFVPFEHVGVYSGYTVTATDSEGFSYTSDPFDVAIVDKPAPTAEAVTQLRYNVSGDTTKGETAIAITAVELRPLILASTIYGNKDEVTFVGIDPINPAGLDFDFTTGTLSGTPNSEFSGKATVTIRDVKNREGTIDIPLHIRPYPTLELPQSLFEIPRLSDSKSVIPKPVPKNPLGVVNTWVVVAPGGAPVPAWLAPNSTVGSVSGTVEEPVGTVLSGLRFRAYVDTSYKQKLAAFSQPFDVKVVAFEKLEIDVKHAGTRLTWQISEPSANDPLYSLVKGPLESYSIKDSGSFVPNLTYSLDPLPNGLNGLGMDPATGAFTGFPWPLGDYQVTVRAKDADAVPAEATDIVDIRATLPGFVEPANTGSVSLRLRQGEPFAIPADGVPVQVSNVVGSPVFSTVPAILPQGVDGHFDAMTGAFDTNSAFEVLPVGNGGLYNVRLVVKDGHDRGFETPNKVTYGFRVYEPIDLPDTVASIAAERFIAIDAVMPAAKNIIGKAAYDVSYDPAQSFPGTLVKMVYDSNDAFIRYEWAGGSAVSADDLPYDAIVFDPLARTLKGRPFKDGTYELTLSVSDDHELGYIGPANTPTNYERDTTPITIVVASGKPLEVSAAVTAYEATQYSPDAKMDISWGAAKNVALGVIYSVEGDVPGTLVYIVRDKAGNPSGYRVADGQGGFTAVPLGGTLPLDALILDDAALKLVGIPSKTGTFTFRIKATDIYPRAHGIAYTDPITLTVAPALDLVASTTVAGQPADVEVLHQYTSVSNMAQKVANAAYGKPLIWTKLSGTLPQNVAAVTGASAVTYAGYPETTGTFGNIVWKAKDVLGREVTFAPAMLTVTTRLPLTLSASSNPMAAIVDVETIDGLVTAANTAYGLPVANPNWTVSGALPAGVTATAGTSGLRFEGKSGVPGKFPVTITASDSRGGSATYPLMVRIADPESPIEVSMVEESPILTKVGVPKTVRFIAANNYGKVKFVCDDTSGQITIHPDTGVMTARFLSVGENTVNVSVTDAHTQRITSVPFTFSVLPPLRVIVPSNVVVAQGTALNQSVDTAYLTGTVTYRKGSGAWPSNFDVKANNGEIVAVSTDPSTGTVSNHVVAAPGIYAGLTVRAETISAPGFVESVESNVFSIQVDPVNANPVITDTGSTATNKLLLTTVGMPYAFKPTVKDSIRNLTWTYAGTQYELNHDLKADTGLDFDTTTGVISGTATKPMIYTDLTIRVTSAKDDTDVTMPFWFGVQPTGAIEFAGNSSDVHRGKIEALQVLFVNAYRDRSHAFVGAAPGLSISPQGVISGEPTGEFEATVKVTDAFGRIGAGTLKFAPNIKVSMGKMTVERGLALVDPDRPRVENAGGPPTFIFDGLPAGLTYNAATGAISGATSMAAGTYPVTVSVSDGYTNASATFDMVVATRRWRILFDQWAIHATSPNCVGLAEFRVMSGGGVNIAAASQVSSLTASESYAPVSNLVDGSLASSNYWFTTVAGQKGLSFTPPNGQTVSGLELVYRQDGYNQCNPTKWRVQSTIDEGANWGLEWSGTGSGAVKATVKTGP